MKHTLLRIGALIVSLLPLLSVQNAFSKATDTASKPNIIFIYADDWGYGDLGIHGSTFCKTPNLDRMAAEGIDFQNFTVANPVCSPSRTSVITGHFPARHSVQQHFASTEHHVRAGMPDWLDPKAPMMPRMLKKAGYATAHFGKWHLCNDHITDGPNPIEYGYDEFGAFNLPSGLGVQMKTTATCPRAADFIRRHKDQPFFINLWLHETHTPHYPLQEYLDQFEDLDEQKKVYAAVVAEGDAGVGLILDTLKELGLDDNTIVLFSSDNGPEWTGTKKKTDDASTGPGYGSYYSVGEKGDLKGQKRSLHAGGIRVPFIVRWPGVVPAGRIDRDSVVTTVDMFPTFAELAGASHPSGYQPDGESIVSALKGKTFERSKAIFWEWKPGRETLKHPYIWPNFGISEGDWKLLMNEKIGRYELYSISGDWKEAVDVSDKHPKVVKRLVGRIKEWAATLPENPPAHCFSKNRGE